MFNEGLFLSDRLLNPLVRITPILQYWPTKNKDDSPYEFTAEGLSVKLAKGKAIEKFLKQTFGPDLSKKKEREITSIRMIKPVNRDGCDDPPLPPSARSRGDRRGDCPDSVPGILFTVYNSRLIYCIIRFLPYYT